MDANEHLEQIGRSFEELSNLILEARRRIGDFFRKAPLPCCIAARDRFVLVNDAWTKALGWSEDDLKSNPWMSFVHPDDREATAREAAEMEDRMAYEFINRWRCKDGTYHLLRWRTTVWDEHGLAYCCAWDLGPVEDQK